MTSPAATDGRCLHGKGNVGAKAKAGVVAEILAAVRERKA
jgi:hypothetical protein